MAHSCLYLAFAVACLVEAWISPFVFRMPISRRLILQVLDIAPIVSQTAVFSCDAP